MLKVGIRRISRPKGGWRFAKRREAVYVFIFDDVESIKIITSPGIQKVVWLSNDFCGDYKGGVYGYGAVLEHAEKLAKEEAEEWGIPFVGFV